MIRIEKEKKGTALLIEHNHIKNKIFLIIDIILFSLTDRWKGPLPYCKQTNDILTLTK